MNDCPVAAGNAVVFQLLCQAAVSPVVFADNQNSCGILVNAMDNARTQYTVNSGQRIPAMIQRPLTRVPL